MWALQCSLGGDLHVRNSNVALEGELEDELTVLCALRLRYGILGNKIIRA